MMNVLHTKADGDFIKKNASCVIIGENKYYYFPYWLEDNGTGMYTQIPFERLPKELVDDLVENRSILEKEKK